MILELADIRIHPGQQAAFDEAIQRGLLTVISQAKGFQGFKVNKGIESPERYILQIFWATLENHTVDFRESAVVHPVARHRGALLRQPPGGGAFRAGRQVGLTHPRHQPGTAVCAYAPPAPCPSPIFATGLAMPYVFTPPAPITVPVYRSAQQFPVHRIYCVGRNYEEHAKEMGFTGREPPFFFMKPADAIVAVQAGATGAMPYPSLTSNLHHEIELVIAIGTGGRNIKAADAHRHIFGMPWAWT